MSEQPSLQISNGHKLFLVEDDQQLGAALCEQLEQYGFDVTWQRTMQSALHALEHLKVDAALIDIGLPDGDGFQIGRALKKISAVPILFLSAQNTAERRLESFELGGEDYIPKPFHVREVILRLHRILRTTVAPVTTTSSGIKIDHAARCLYYPDGRRVYPKTTDFRVLEILIEASPQLVTREELDKILFGKDRGATPRSIDNVITRLRGLLGLEAAQHIRAVRGSGYQWCPVITNK
jgi:two-component system phosphate regulon response regulator PhoB